MKKGEEDTNILSEEEVLEFQERYILGRNKGKSPADMQKALYITDELKNEFEYEYKRYKENEKKVLVSKNIHKTKNDGLSRLDSLLNIMERIDLEISKRNFEDIPTDKLILLKLKLNEYAEPKIINIENNSFIDD
ncbi:MAG: hypothetical protein KDK36_09630 [Leptospiraceae bacterium]|nr:hypothetical protein [Leptospiraceae bacterium]